MKSLKLERTAFICFPICVVAAIFVFANRFGWASLRLELGVYAFMIVSSIIAYYLIKKMTFLFGSLSLSLWKGDSFKNMPIHILTLRYKIAIYFSIILAGSAFIGGIFYGNDLFVLFAWTILGFTISNQKLLAMVNQRSKE